MVEIDDMDAMLLDAIQAGLPLTSRPFQTLANQLGITEKEVLKRLVKLKETGLVRRIGPVLSSSGLGYSSALIACSVSEGQVEKTAALISRLPNVTHNYRREPCEGTFAYNLWFTLFARNQGALDELVDKLQNLTGCRMLALLYLRKFKLHARFSVQGTG